jgi:exopolyphosphatase/guanosine-5'-triphosphate,3'-diphosphate pyrophosphatase
LAALPLAARRTLPALDPDRAPVIVAGAVVLREAMSVLDLGELEASDHDLLHGAVLEAAELPEPVDGNAPAGAHACC